MNKAKQTFAYTPKKGWLCESLSRVHARCNVIRFSLTNANYIYHAFKEISFIKSHR